MDDEHWDTSCSIEEVIEQLCKDDPSFREYLEKAQNQLDSMSKEEQTKIVDTVFRKIT